ncbi:hypothetical protein PR048_014866, partial [Dryococelus australis]
MFHHCLAYVYWLWGSNTAPLASTSQSEQTTRIPCNNSVISFVSRLSLAPPAAHLAWSSSGDRVPRPSPLRRCLVEQRSPVYRKDILQLLVCVNLRGRPPTTTTSTWVRGASRCTAARASAVTILGDDRLVRSPPPHPCLQDLPGACVPEAEGLGKALNLFRREVAEREKKGGEEEEEEEEELMGNVVRGYQRQVGRQHNSGLRGGVHRQGRPGIVAANPVAGESEAGVIACRREAWVGSRPPAEARHALSTLPLLLNHPSQSMSTLSRATCRGAAPRLHSPPARNDGVASRERICKGERKEKMRARENPRKTHLRADWSPTRFQFVGHVVEARVYATPVDDVSNVRKCIVAGCETIMNFSGIHQCIRVSMQWRIDPCVRADGAAHFSAKTTFREQSLPAECLNSPHKGQLHSKRVGVRPHQLPAGLPRRRSSHRYTQFDENTARQLRSLRLVVMAHLIHMEVSPLSLPHFSTWNAEKIPGSCEISRGPCTEHCYNLPTNNMTGHRLKVSWNELACLEHYTPVQNSTRSGDDGLDARVSFALIAPALHGFKHGRQLQAQRYGLQLHARPATRRSYAKALNLRVQCFRFGAVPWQMRS